MNKCQFVQERYGEQYCLATKEQDVCPCYGNPYSQACYHTIEQKEIHFYYDEGDIPYGEPHYTDWLGTLTGIEEGDYEIHTTQMGLLTMSSKLFDAGYRIFIWDDHGEFELTLGNCARTNREIRYTHNHFKMWVSGEFTNYEKETNGPPVI